MSEKTETSAETQPTKKKKGLIDRIFNRQETPEENSAKITIKKDSPFHETHTGGKPSEKDFIKKQEERDVLAEIQQKILTHKIKEARALIEKENISPERLRAAFGKLKAEDEQTQQQIMNRLEEVLSD